VTAGLIRTQDGRHLWADSFDGSPGDVLVLQAELAREVATQIRVHLTSADRERLARVQPIDPKAHEAFLKGQFHWNRRGYEDLQLALSYFERAVAIDPSFALAWVGIANTQVLLPDYGPVSRDSVMPLAREAALKALSLDSTLAEGHAALGNIDKGWTRDWKAAERHYRRALELNPNYAAAHLWYAILLAWNGRVRDAMWEISKARDLDPLSAVTQITVARIAYLNHDYARAAREYRQCIELDSRRSSPWFGLSRSCYRQEQMSQAADALEKGVRMLPDSLGMKPLATTVTTKAKYQSRWLEMTRTLARYDLTSTAEMGAAEAAAGHKSAAFDFLNRAVSDNSLVIGDLVNLPEYDGLRSDPRYQGLLDRLRQDQLR